MKSNSNKEKLCLLTLIIATLSLLALFAADSNSIFNVTYAIAASSQSSSATPSLSESLQQAQQGLQSSINNQINQTYEDTIKDINKNTVITNSSTPIISNTTLKNREIHSSNNTETTTQKVRVGDIDVAYKIFGKGSPLILIPGFSMTMEMWGPILNNLAGNHTIIVFDNRGIGETTAGSNKTFSMEQFVNDTAGLIDKLEIKKPLDVLGLSLGGFIAQELSVTHPEMVKHLILVATSCGGKESIPPQLTPADLQKMQSGTANTTLFLHALFPDKWIKENSNYINKTFALPHVSQENLLKYGEATGKWKGSCDSMSNMDKPVLVMVGTKDITAPPVNSLKLVEKIPGAWLVQIKDGGHGVLQQYPEKVSKIIETFLETTD